MKLDRLGRHEVGGEHEIALVLAVLVVDEDHIRPARTVVDGAPDGVACARRIRRRSTLASTDMGTLPAGQALAPAFPLGHFLDAVEARRDEALDVLR